MREIELPRSKSVLSRLLMMSALKKGEIRQYADNEDIETLVAAFESEERELNAVKSATAARFLIAYAAGNCGRWKIDGEEQLRRRPVRAIVKAVRQLGAEVRYLGENGHLPVDIEGCENWGEEVNADASESSQTISALMLMGSRKGLTIKTLGERKSWGYAELTAEIMRKCGVKVEIDKEQVKVGKGEFEIEEKFWEERDWSAAVLWYGMVAAGRENEVLLRGLSAESLQPDRKAVEVFGRLGVESEEREEGIVIRKSEDKAWRGGFFEMNCQNVPDMAMVLSATLCEMEIPFRLSGLEVLERKESSRGVVMMEELRKSGYFVEWNGEELSWSGEKCRKIGGWSDRDDHRVAMALMILGVDLDLKSIAKSYKLEK